MAVNRSFVFALSLRMNLFGNKGLILDSDNCLNAQKQDSRAGPTAQAVDGRLQGRLTTRVATRLRYAAYGAANRDGAFGGMGGRQRPAVRPHLQSEGAPVCRPSTRNDTPDDSSCGCGIISVLGGRPSQQSPLTVAQGAAGIWHPLFGAVALRRDCAVR